MISSSFSCFFGGIVFDVIYLIPLVFDFPFLIHWKGKIILLFSKPSRTEAYNEIYMNNNENRDDNFFDFAILENYIFHVSFFSTTKKVGEAYP